MRGNNEEDTNMGVEPIDSAPFLDVKRKGEENVQDAVLLVRLSDGSVAMVNSVEYGGKTYDFDKDRPDEWERVLRMASDLKNQVIMDLISKNTASLVLNVLINKDEEKEENGTEEGID